MSEGAEAFPFLDRTRESAVLRRLLHDASEGTGRAAVITGEAGIGKTRQLTELMAYAAGQGCQVLLGSSDELGQDRPLGPLIEAFGLRADSTDPDRAEIGRLITTDTPPPQAPAVDLGFQLIDAAVALLERLSAATPVVVAFEDLHWADPATLRAVRVIGRALPRLAVLLLVTMRPFPERPELTRMIEELVSHGADRLELPALGNPAVSALAAAVAGAPPGTVLTDQLSWAAGNPLFVIELVKALREQGTLTVHQGRADVADHSLPSTLPATILRRTNLLPAATLEVLRMAAVLGREFSVAELAIVTGRGAVTLLPELDGALRAGLLSESPTGLTFRHELIREAIYHDLALPLRQAIHREVARALTAAGVPPAQLADHLFLGATATDPESIRGLRQAAGAAASRSPAVAVKLYERAFELTSTDDPNRDAVATELAPLLLQTGRPKDAEQLAREILARGPLPTHEAVLRRALGEVLFAIGWLEPAVAELEAAARVPGASTCEQANALALAAHIRLFLGDPQRALTQAQQARSAAPEDDVVSCLALQTIALATNARGDVAAAVNWAQQAVEVATRSRDPRIGRLSPHLFLGVVLIDADRRAEARTVLQRGRRLGEERGNVMWLPLHHAMLAVYHIVNGELTDAAAEAQAGLALADEVGIRLHAALLHGAAAWVALQRGDIAAGEAHMVDAAAEFTASVAQDWQLTAAAAGLRTAGARWPLEWGLYIQALLFEAQGQLETARALLEDAWELAAPLRFVLSHRFLGPDLVRVAIAAGDRERAAVVTRELAEGAGRAGVAGAFGAALRCQGLLDDDPVALLAAMDAYRQLPQTAELALACEDAGACLVRAGRGAEAVPVLEEALEFYQRTGAHRGSARTDAALRALGVRRRRSGPLRRASVGWESLTSSELRVAQLAAEGLTNPQIGDRLFISRRTVATHLANAFRKLGINNRVQLAAEVSHRFPPGPHRKRPTTKRD